MLSSIFSEEGSRDCTMCVVLCVCGMHCESLVDRLCSKDGTKCAVCLLSASLSRCHPTPRIVMRRREDLFVFNDKYRGTKGELD